jgi:hypothetical protein
MKILKSFLIALFIVSFFAACKKNETEPAVTPVSIDGSWTGKLTYTDGQKDSFTTTISKDNTALELKIGSDVFTGTWLLNSNVFTADFTANGFNLKGTFDSQSGTVTDGTIGAVPGYSGSGTWSMVKEK